jgi:hypothetical protein
MLVTRMFVCFFQWMSNYSCKVSVHSIILLRLWCFFACNFAAGTGKPLMIRRSPSTLGTRVRHTQCRKAYGREILCTDVRIFHQHVNIGSMFKIESDKYYNYDVTAYVTNWRRRTLVPKSSLCVCGGGGTLRLCSYVASNSMMTDDL